MYFKLFFRYLHHHRRTLILCALFTGVFAMVFSLYRLEVEAVGYAAVLSLVAGLLVAVPDFLRYVSRHKKLLRLTEQLLLTEQKLPYPDNLVEQDYQELVQALVEDKRHTVSAYDRARRERADYDVLWAHQIKTPIAAMRLLLQEADTPEYRELSAQLFSVEQYVEMVLSYMRLDSPANDFVIRSCSLDTCVKQAVRKYAGQFVRRKLALSREDTGFLVLSDEKWLVFVIEQLLSNALKYTPSGGISIHAGEGGKVLVIKDTGIGIAREDLPRIFEKGYTGLNGRTGQKSTGIGLYLCKRILGKLGHRMWIESEIGEGTRVFLDLEEYKGPQL